MERGNRELGRVGAELSRIPAGGCGGNAEAGDPEPLGKSAAVRKAISKHLTGVDWSDSTWGVYEGDGFTIEFNMGAGDLVDSIMLAVRGEGDAIAAMLSFAQPNGRSLFDCSTSEFIDPQNPSEEGWEGFQELNVAEVATLRGTREIPALLRVRLRNDIT